MDTLGFGIGGNFPFHGLFAAAAVIGVMLGGWQTYRGIRDGKQVEISCDDYVNERPRAHWVKLENCEYNFDHYAIYREGTQITKVYLPLRANGDATSKPHIVVVRTDEATIDLVNAFEQKKQPSEAVLEKARVQLDKPIEGIVTTALDVEGGNNGKLEDLKIGLADDFVVIDSGAIPHLLAGILGLVGGCVAGIVASVLFVRARRRERNRPPPSRRAPPHTPPEKAVDPNNPISQFERPV